MLTLQDFANKHKEWLKIANYLGADSATAKEIVQQMYLKIGELQIKEGNLEKLVNYSGGINTVYVFKVIQNLYYDFHKRKEYGADFTNFEYELEPVDDQEQKYQVLIHKLKRIIQGFGEYEQMLLELYFVNGCSLRDIAKSTGIGVHSIFNTIKNAKEKLKKQTKNDYRAYRESRNTRTTIVRFGGHDCESNQSDWD
jgi:RNA polymerase sigma factor (sigma-70 family)